MAMADRFPISASSVSQHGSGNSARRRFLKLLLSGTALTITPDLIAGDGKPALPNSPQETQPVVVHVDCERLQQEIQGFGVSAAFHQAHNLMSYPRADVSRVLDLLFSQTAGAGLSIVRNIVGDGGVWGKETDGPTPTIEPREGVWEWTGDEEQIWFMNEAKSRGCTRFISTVWSPPAWMKTNTNVIDGSLSREKYQAFADYLCAYVRGYKQHHDIDIYAISPTNEPDYSAPYSSCRWTGEELRDFLKDYLKPTMKRNGVTARVMIAEQSTWGEEYAIPALEDPVALDAVDIVAAHAYAENNEPFSKRTGRLEEALRHGKPIWQTEVSTGEANDTSIANALFWAKLVHFHLAENQVNAWCYWWAVTCYNNCGALIYMDLTDPRLVVAKRLFAIGNFSRFLRPGCLRIEADSNPAPGVYVSAYQNPPCSELYIVAINENAGSDQRVDIHLGGFAGAAMPYRTSKSEDLVKLSEIPVVHSTIKATLLNQSVTTFVVRRHV
jgi:glucuronoarabinoxylan endo-1,4-beta-xylanase